MSLDSRDNAPGALVAARNKSLGLSAGVKLLVDCC